MSEFENLTLPIPPDPESGEGGESRSDRMVRLAVEMRQLGVKPSHVRRILMNYDLDDIEAQLRFLPYRKFRNKASMLVASIDQSFEEPANFPHDEQ